MIRAVADTVRRARRWWWSWRPDRCPVCGTACRPDFLAMHALGDHTDEELRTYVEEVGKR